MQNVAQPGAHMKNGDLRISQIEDLKNILFFDIHISVHFCWPMHKFKFVIPNLWIWNGEKKHILFFFFFPICPFVPQMICFFAALIVSWSQGGGS